MHVRPSTSARQRGFSLIDVLVAIAMFAGGLLALTQLEINLTRVGTDAQIRTLAASLAEEQIEVQRRFTRTGIDPNGLQHSYADIVNSSSTRTVGNVELTVSQTVTDYYWDRSTAQFTTTAPLGATLSDFKRLHVVVSWNDALEHPIDEDTSTSGHLGSASVALDTLISSEVSATRRLALIDDLNGDGLNLPLGEAVSLPPLLPGLPLGL